jgi:hypothetical protein
LAGPALNRHFPAYHRRFHRLENRDGARNHAQRFGEAQQPEPSLDLIFKMHLQPGTDEDLVEVASGSPGAADQAFDLDLQVGVFKFRAPR